MRLRPQPPLALCPRSPRRPLRPPLPRFLTAAAPCRPLRASVPSPAPRNPNPAVPQLGAGAVTTPRTRPRRRRPWRRRDRADGRDGAGPRVPNLGISSCSVNSPPQSLPFRDSRSGDPACLFPIDLRCFTALLQPRLDIFVDRSVNTCS